MGTAELMQCITQIAKDRHRFRKVFHLDGAGAQQRISKLHDVKGRHRNIL